MITLFHLSKQYGKHLVLDDISLTFPDTGLVLIEGENGSGKTTLLYILAMTRLWERAPA